MKKLFLSFSLFAATGNVLLAQKTINDPNAEKRNVSGFHGIEVSTGINLILTEGVTEEVAISAATDEYRSRITTKVENGILKIYYDHKLSLNTKKQKKELKAYVSYKSLNRLGANTGATVRIEGTLKAASLKMKVNTGAEVKGSLLVDDLEVDQDTGSEITLTGETGKLDVDGDTGSIFKGIDFKTNNCNVTASTGAEIFISVQIELNVKASLGGVVKYKGDATIREIKTNTGGSVFKI